MFGLSKVCDHGISIGLTLVTPALAGGITNVQATPVCSSTMVLPGGADILDFTQGQGVWLQSADWLYGASILTNLARGW